MGQKPTCLDVHPDFCQGAARATGIFSLLQHGGKTRVTPWGDLGQFVGPNLGLWHGSAPQGQLPGGE